MSASSRAYIETGNKRVFACSLEWPGLSRSGKTEEAALSALGPYVPRYSPVAARAGIDFDLSEDEQWLVVERVPTRSGGADFGVPTTVLASDYGDLGADEASRTAALLSASWEFLDAVAAEAPPELRKGPRGGGRDRDAVVSHVAAAEQMFGRKVGFKLPVPAPGDARRRRRQQGGDPGIGAGPGTPVPWRPRRLVAACALRREAAHLACARPRVGDRGPASMTLAVGV